MGIIAPTIPAISFSRGAEELDCGTALSTIQTLVNGNIDATNAVPLMASSNYRLIAQTSGNAIQPEVSGTLLQTVSGSTTMRSGVAESADGPYGIPLFAADHAVSGLTTKLKLSATVITNNDAPGTITLTYGLYPYTSATSTGNNMTITVGAVVTGSTVARVNPLVNNIYTDSTSDFTFPSDGVYLMAVATSAALTTSTEIVMSLYVRNV